MASRTPNRRGPASGARGLALAGLGLAVGILAGCSGAGSPSPTAGPSSAGSGAPASPSGGPTGTPAASVAATTGPCAATSLAARITLWEGAAGSRIAHLELTNTGPVACLLPPRARPQLVDGKGSVLIDGAAGGASPSTAASAAPDLVVAAGGVVKTLVRAGNYCGPAVTPPVSVAFVLPSGGRFVATPVSATDAGVPPCLGDPGSAGSMEMQAWAP